MSSRFAIIDGHPALLERANGTNGHRRPELFELLAKQAASRADSRRSGGPIEATYDAARDSDEFKNYWANADALNSDSANSKLVRSKLVRRSRYETDNDGYADGIVQSHANFVVGLGPSLRMQSASSDFNAEVETRHLSWCQAIQFRRKLWCLNHAKTQDGEGLGLMRSNPGVNDPVKLDVVPIETEQCTTPYLDTVVLGYIDGIKFDEFGNPSWYDVLPYHPGSNFGAFPGLATFYQQPERIPARFMLHWYLLRRPGQHRGVPEFKSTLNTGAASRRFREATVAAAETAADPAAVIRTAFQPDEMDLVAPMSTIEWQKRMMLALPSGYGMEQLKAEHPNAQYDTFLRQQISERARPKAMPYNLAACDSSTYSFASGKLDTLGYFAALDCERADGNDLVLEPLFRRWWFEAVLVYGWNADPFTPPPHTYDWPRHPIIDAVAEATASDMRLKNGSLSLSKLYADQGLDFDDEIEELARDYGVSVDEMRAILRQTIFSGAAPQPATTQPLPQGAAANG